MESLSSEVKKLSRWNKFVRFFFRLLSAGVISLFFLSYVTAHLRPTVFGYFSVLGLFFGPLLLLHLFSALIMVIRKEWKWLIVFGVCFLLSLPDFLSFVSFQTEKKIEFNSDDLVVMTYNTHLMGFYDGLSSTKNRDAILAEIRNVRPKVLCLQECYWNTDGGDFMSIQRRNEIILNANIHERTTHVLSDGGRFGLVIFSTYPMISKGQVPFENEVNNFCIYADVLVGSDTLRIYNAHLQSFRLKKKSLELFDENIDMTEIQNESKPLFIQLYKSSEKRALQVDVLSKHIEDCRYPCILTGDFNDTPVSYTYNKLTRFLSDSFKEAGSGIGSTYKGPLFGLRIDYILHSKNLKAKGYQTIDGSNSDHRAVIASF